MKSSSSQPDESADGTAQEISVADKVTATLNALYATEDSRLEPHIEALMLEAFEYAVERLNQRYRTALEGESDAVGRLNAVLAVFEATITDPPMRGGCPLLNAATESDDALPVLRSRVRRAINGCGQLDGQLRRDVNAVSTASVIFSALEGAVMLSRLYRDPAHIRNVVAFLRVYLHSLKQTDQS